MEDTVPRLVTNKTDLEKAIALRQKLAPVLEQACTILNEARAEGLVLGFNISADQYGRSRIAEISVVKPL